VTVRRDLAPRPSVVLFRRLPPSRSADAVLRRDARPERADAALRPAAGGRVRPRRGRSRCAAPPRPDIRWLALPGSAAPGG